MVAYFAIMLPGRAMLTVWWRGLVGVKTADGLDVSFNDLLFCSAWLAVLFLFCPGMSVVMNGGAGYRRGLESTLDSVFAISNV